MDKRFADFLKVAKLLNRLEIVPTLYGSLGLYQIIPPLSAVDDIDLLLPEVWLKQRWDEFKAYLESHGYKMDDEHEHEFSHPDISCWVAFSSLEEAHRYFGLDTNALILQESGGIRYYSLAAEHYLATYRAALKDSYRQDRKGDADRKKIEAIERYLQIKGAEDSSS